MTLRFPLSRTAAVAATAVALLLGGCAGTPNRGLESVHQPVVSRADVALDLRTYGGSLGPDEEARLAGWLDGLRVGYGDRVALEEDPAAYARQARAEVARALAAHGLLLQPGRVVPASPVPPDAVRVVVSRMRASVPGCPDWSRNGSHEFESNTSSSYGCAVNANLAAMIASPADLLRGRDGPATTDPRQSGKAINAYRSAAPGGGGGQTVKSESAGGK